MQMAISYREPFSSADSDLPTQIYMRSCIAQRLGEILEFDTMTKQITDARAHELKGNPPRNGWEEFKRLEGLTRDILNEFTTDKVED